MRARARCGHCNVELERRRYEHVEHVGSVTVTDEADTRASCPRCGETLLSVQEHARYERRAAATVLREGAHVNGAVVLYARKALGLRQTELAALLGYTPESVCKWENDKERVPRATQLAVAALLDAVNMYGCVEPVAPDRSAKPHLEVPTVRRTA